MHYQTKFCKETKQACFQLFATTSAKFSQSVSRCQLFKLFILKHLALFPAGGEVEYKTACLSFPIATFRRRRFTQFSANGQ